MENGHEINAQGRFKVIEQQEEKEKKRKKKKYGRHGVIDLSYLITALRFYSLCLLTSIAADKDNEVIAAKKQGDSSAKVDPVSSLFLKLVLTSFSLHSIIIN